MFGDSFTIYYEALLFSEFYKVFWRLARLKFDIIDIRFLSHILAPF